MAHTAIEGMRFHAFHGVHPEEALVGNQFSVDVYFDHGFEGETDDLAHCIDAQRHVGLSKVQFEAVEWSQVIRDIAGLVVWVSWNRNNRESESIWVHLCFAHLGCSHFHLI